MRKVLVIRAPGTNCDLETLRAVKTASLPVFEVHTRKLTNGDVDLFDYYGLIIPGGFSYGDSVRAGAIWARKLGSKVLDTLTKFSSEGRPILGICNGFQVLVELGLLPGWDASGPKIALAPNVSGKFECRWVHLVVSGENDVFFRYYPLHSILRMPVAHSEGRFFVSDDTLKCLSDGGQILLRYALPDGHVASQRYPFNPNGSMFDVAGVCNTFGNVLGLMPHPERAVYAWQYPESHVRMSKGFGDGYWIFKSMCDYILEELV